MSPQKKTGLFGESYTMRALLILLVTTLTIAWGYETSSIKADSGSEPESQIHLIVIDERSFAIQSDADIAKTAALTVVGGISNGDLGVVGYGRKFGTPVLVDVGPDSVSAVETEIQRSIKTRTIIKSDQFEMLTSAYSFLNGINAGSGSRIFIITSGDILGESDNIVSRMGSVGDLYSKAGWQIDLATLKSTESKSRDLLSELPKRTGGHYYDLGASDGLINLVNQAFDVQLDNILDAELNGSKIAANFDIAPHAGSIKVAFVRFNSETEVSLFRPGGTKVSESLSNVSIIESPNVVIVNVDNPISGSWVIEGIGENGKLLASIDYRSDLAIELVDDVPSPMNETALLSAVSYVSGEVKPIPGSTITARILQPDGFINVYQLNDDGMAGDEVAQDGIFSIQLPSNAKDGIHDVALTMTWDNLKAVITGKGTFKTEMFPSVSIVQTFDFNAHHDERGLVARIETRVGKFPYLVGRDDLNLTIHSPGASYEAEAVLVSEPESGKGFLFDIFGIIPESGVYDLEVTLVTEYLGRKYVTPMATTAVTVIITPYPFEIFGLPLWSVVILGIIVVSGLFITILRSRKISAFGCLYDDQNNLIVDFSKLKRNLFTNLFSPDRIYAREIPNLPFNGGSFYFTKNGVRLENKPTDGDPSIRVNSRPATDLVELSGNVWLGVGGQLMYFSCKQNAVPNLTPSLAND